MAEHEVRFGGSGIPQTILPVEGDEVVAAIASAKELSGDRLRERVAEAAARNPRSLLVWAELGDAGRDTVESYAYYRIGYHRGLDTLRQNGWRGSGYVRWKNESNQPFLRCLEGLQRHATLIGETDEAERCALFLLQLDPTWPPSAE